LANLRMSVYGIPMQSRFQNKGIAGNIVHAIATTNAIAGGLIVLEAIKILSGRIEDCRTVWIQRTGPNVLQPQRLEPSNKLCIACSQACVTLFVDCTKFTVGQLFESVLRGSMGMNDPGIDVTNRDNYIGSREDCEPDYLVRTLSDAGVRIDNGAMLTVDDQTQEFKCQLIVQHKDDFDDEKEPLGFRLEGGEKLSGPTSAESSGKDASEPAEEPSRDEEDDDDIIMIEEVWPGAASGKRNSEYINDPPSKRARVEVSEDVIEIN
jgi:ubiquitin-like 1-activating enzyme E1 B